MTGLKTTTTARKRFLSNLYPRQKWTPSQWAETCRELSEEESSEPGPYSFDRTPFWRFPLDLLAEPGVETVVVLKGAQIGYSEMCRNAMGYWIDCDPAPMLVLAADRLSAQAFREERLDPMFAHTTAIRRHMSDRASDNKKFRIRFDTCSVFLAWAGSKTGTKTRPVGRLICEEPDEYPPFSSSGGDPLSKAEKRLTTYRDKGRARILIGGTPTNRLGNIWKQWELCSIRYWYWVPCLHCNGYQRLFWKNVKYPAIDDIPERAKRAEKVKSELLAYYECEHCHKPIRDHQKPAMLRRGIWASEDQVVTHDGRVVGPQRTASRIGICLSGLYSPWVGFSDLAAEWIMAQGDIQALADFINQRLAECFEEERSKIEESVIEAKAKDGPEPGIIPAWATHLFATADTQGNDEATGHFKYVIRAWTWGYRSQLIEQAVCKNKEEVIEHCLHKQFPMANGGFASPSVLVWDTGGRRTKEIYRISLADTRIHPAKGSSIARTWMVTERPHKKHKVVLWLIDTEQSKDLLHSLITDTDPTVWMMHNAVDTTYKSQLQAEAKIFDPRERRETWREIVKNNNDYWDCEHMQCAVAWRMGLGAGEKPQPKAGRWGGGATSRWAPRS